MAVDTMDVLATSLFLGGAIIVLAFALFSYMGLLSIFPSNHATFYAGKHVLITGGSSGIGKELARLLLSAGASVTLVARNPTRLAAAAKELEPPGESNAASARINVFAIDCSDPLAVDEMIDTVERQNGAVDILVNSAGSAVGGYFEQLDTSAFRAQMEGNYFSHVYPAHAMFKRMARRRAGHIVFLSSIAGQTGVFGQSAYCPTKFAIRGLAEALYFEGKPFGINITLVFPPDTDTPGLKQERIHMPPETLEISKTGGLFSAEKVAHLIADGVMRNRFRVCVGFIGSVVGILTAGLTPGFSFVDIFMAPILRLVVPFIIWDQNKVIRKGHAVRTASNQVK